MQFCQFDESCRQPVQPVTGFNLFPSSTTATDVIVDPPELETVAQSKTVAVWSVASSLKSHGLEFGKLVIVQ